MEINNEEAKNNKKEIKVNKEEEEEYDAQDIDEITRHSGEFKNGKFINEYEICEKVGTGSFCKVKRIVRSFYDENQNIIKGNYAMKVKLNKKFKKYVVYEADNTPIMSNYLEQVYQEVKVWRTLLNNNILKLFQILDDSDDNELLLVMQFADFGQIMDWNSSNLCYKLNNKVYDFIRKHFLKDLKFENERMEFECVGKTIFRFVLNGIEYLHKRKIVHRDIKPDNILCKPYKENEIEEFPIKLADFTTAKNFENKDSKFYDIAGTPGFRCPETMFVTEGGYYPTPCDIWSFGVTIYVYFNEGKLPFYAESEIEMDMNSKNMILEYPKHLFSETLQDLLKKMIKKKPEERITLEEVKNHPWFKKS